MVSLIAGEKGSGKSKKMIEMANADVDAVAGHVVFIDDDNRNIYDLHHDLRFINMDEYPIESVDEFYGFICGLLSNDYDIEKIYIDGIMNCMEIELPQVVTWLERTDDLSQKYNVEFVMTLSCGGPLPASIAPFAI